MVLGSTSNSVARGLTGLLDEVRIYKRALTDADILGIYNYSPQRSPTDQLDDGHSIEEHYCAWVDYFKEYFRQRARGGLNCEIAPPGLSGLLL